MREEFDFEAALAALQDGQGLTGKEGIEATISADKTLCKKAAILVSIPPLGHACIPCRATGHCKDNRLVATRFNPDMKAKYHELIAKGKCKKLSITAVMRKLVVMANALLRDGLDLSRFRSAPGAHLSGLSFKSQWTFPV